MNERIKELAERAGFDVEETTGGGDVWFDEGWNTELVERFAELVRQDEREACAYTCEINADGDWTSGALACATAIRARSQA